MFWRDLSRDRARPERQSYLPGFSDITPPMVGVALHFEKDRRGCPQTVDSLLWDETAPLSICFTPVIGRNQVDDFLPLIDFVKKSPGTDAVAPGWWFPVLQSLDIGAVMGVGPQLGIGIGF